MTILDISDTRWGRKGKGIYIMIPGCLAGFYQSGLLAIAIFSEELFKFETLRWSFIWCFLLFGVFFFFYISTMALILFVQSRNVIQRASSEGGYLSLTTYLGGSAWFDMKDVRFHEIAPQKRFMTMKMMSNKRSNWKIIIRGREFFINGEVSGVDDFIELILARKESNNDVT